MNLSTWIYDAGHDAGWQFTGYGATFPILGKKMQKWRNQNPLKAATCSLYQPRSCDIIAYATNDTDKGCN